MHRIHGSIVCSLLLSLALLGCQSDEEKKAEHMARGAQYVEDGALDEAIIEYKNAIQLSPNDAEAHYELSQVYLKNKQPRAGFWELRETVRLDPSNHDAALQFAQISIYAGELEEAIERADSVIAADPENVTAYMVKGQAHAGLKQPAEALAAFEKAVEIGPENPPALFVLGNHLRQQGNRDAAEPLFVQASELKNSATGFLALASFLAEDRDRDAETEAVYRKAIEVSEPDELARSYQSLGGFYFSRDRFDESVATIEEGIEKVEDPLDLIYLLARMYSAQGEQEKADELAERATQVRPDDARPYLVLSTHRGRAGDLEGALAAAEKAVEIEPDNDFARLRRAEVLLEIGVGEKDEARVTEAREVVESVLENEPSNASALFVKGKLDLAEGRPQEAITGLRAAIDIRPDWVEAHFLLGTALSVTGERTAARTELARALEIDASFVPARRALALVHGGLGEHEYAVEEGNRYLKARPKDNAARVRIAQSLVMLGRQGDALALVEEIPEDERDAEVMFAIGRIHQQQGDDAGARVYLEAALDSNPNHPAILRSLLQLDNRTGDLTSSKARIEAAVAEDPENPELQRLVAAVALAENRSADAEVALKRAIELGPEDIDNYRQLATFYARTGRTQQTIDTYEQALTVNPDQPQIHHFLGVLYEYGGQGDKAVSHYEAAIRYAPDLGESKNNLAYIYAERDEKLDRALDLAQEAKALLPDDPNAADTLGWVLYKRGVPSAAIGYLREAEAGFEDTDNSRGLVQYHLAMAYKDSGDHDRARETLDRAISGQDTRTEAAKAAGNAAASEPPWYADARTMRESL